MSEIAARVKAIIVDKLGVEESEVTNEASQTLKECMTLNSKLYQLITSMLPHAEIKIGDDNE